MINGELFHEPGGRFATHPIVHLQGVIQEMFDAAVVIEDAQQYRSEPVGKPILGMISREQPEERRIPGFPQLMENDIEVPFMFIEIKTAISFSRQYRTNDGQFPAQGDLFVSPVLIDEFIPKSCNPKMRIDKSFLQLVSL